MNTCLNMKPHDKTGLLITFCGLDGCGKTTMINALWDYLNQKMDTDGRKNYENLFWTPLESRQAGRCDEKSLKLLYVAMLRSMGVPARLRPLDDAAEYWKDGKSLQKHSFPFQKPLSPYQN